MLDHLGVRIYPYGTAKNVEFRKIIITSESNFKVVYIDKSTNKRVVMSVDVSHDLRDGISYVNSDPEALFRLLHSKDSRGLVIEIHLRVTSDAYNSMRQLSAIYSVSNTSRNSFPQYAVAPDESAVDEAATETIALPFTEEPSTVWKDIMERKLTIVARRFIEGVDQKWVPILTLADDFLGEGASTSKEGRQYSQTINWARGMIGYGWQQVQRAVSAETNKPTRATVEKLIEKIEAQIPTKETVEDFFHDADRVKWYNAHRERQIRLAKIISTTDGRHDFGAGNPGEILVDINAAHRTEGGVNHANAQNDWEECVIRCHGEAWSSKRRTELETIEYSL